MGGLGDVGGMVADALDVLGDEQQMRAGRDVARILHHVGEQLAEQAGIHLVDFLVAMPHVDGTIRIVIRIGVEHVRSEEHTSELQSLMRISYAVFCLKKKKKHKTNHT